MVHWFASANNIIIPILGLLTIIITVVVPFIPPELSKPRIAYKVVVAAPLLNAPTGARQDLKVLYGGEQLSDPHLVEIKLNSRGSDIPTRDFDKEFPLQFDFGANVIAIVQSEFSPNKQPLPSVRAKDKMLEIGPSLIRGRQEMTFAVLVDGPDVKITCSNPIINVRVKEESSKPKRTISPRTIFAYAAIAYILFFVIKDPAGFAHIINNIGNFFASLARGMLAS